MSVEKELNLAQAFYRRARKERDVREMRRQAREISHLSRRLAAVMSAGGVR
jgi:hypothetical protein